MNREQVKTGRRDKFGKSRGLTFGLVFWLAAALTQVQLATAQGAENALEAISFSALGGGRIELVLTMSGPVAAPKSFTTSDPARIAFDFTATENHLAKRSLVIGIGATRSVAVVQAQGRTRVVINLLQTVAYQTRIDGNRFIITLDGAGGTLQAQAVSGVAALPAAPAAQPDGQGARAVSKVDFRRGPNGEGRILVMLTDPGVVVDTRMEGGDIIVDFADTALPDALARKLDVIDFATPVMEIETFPKGSGVRMRITAIQPGEFEYFSYQADRLFTVELKPISEEEREEERKARQEYSGERLSLNFQNIEVRAVLQLLADFTDLNMVVSDTVTGNITLRLKNVPWDQALDIVLKTKGLDKRVIGNVMTVAPSAEIMAQEAQEFQREQQIERQAPLFTELIQVNYAKAEEIAGILRQDVGDEGDDQAIISSRGSITVDPRTNILIVKDTAENLVRIREMVAVLDVSVRQVMIESRIVIATDSFARDLGIKFGLGLAAVSGDNFSAIGGAQSASGNIQDLGAGLPGFAGSDPLLVNLPAPNPSGSLNFLIGKAGESLLRLELSAMQTEGRGEVLSNPRVLTSEKQTATIRQGVQIPYPGGDGGTIFQTAQLELKVTPQITPDEQIIMELSVTKGEPSARTFGGAVGIDTREVTTTVQVANGETVVLGGIYEQKQSETNEKVPFFGDLPYIGRLFRSKLESNSKNELLIFITPKILQDFALSR